MTARDPTSAHTRSWMGFELIAVVVKWIFRVQSCREHSMWRTPLERRESLRVWGNTLESNKTKQKQLLLEWALILYNITKYDGVSPGLIKVPYCQCVCVPISIWLSSQQWARSVKISFKTKSIILCQWNVSLFYEFLNWEYLRDLVQLEVSRCYHACFGNLKTSCKA